MPYRTKFSRRRKPRYYRRAGRKYVPRPIKRYVRKALDKNVEDKYVAWSAVTQFGSINTNWSELNVSDVSQGVNAGQRIGRRIRIKSLYIRGVIGAGCNQVATDDAYNVIRFVVGTYQNGAGTTPLQSATLGISQPLIKTEGFANIIHRKYADRYIPLNVSSTEKGQGDGYTPHIRNFVYYKRFKNLYITFGSDANQNTPDKRLIVSMLSDSALAVNPGFFNGYITFRFEDA